MLAYLLAVVIWAWQLFDNAIRLALPAEVVSRTKQQTAILLLAASGDSWAKIVVITAGTALRWPLFACAGTSFS
jgi:hypothetical protein